MSLLLPARPPRRRFHSRDLPHQSDDDDEDEGYGGWIRGEREYDTDQRHYYSRFF